MTSKNVQLSVVIGAAISSGFKKTFQTAEARAAGLGTALAKTNQQAAKIQQFKTLKKSVGSTAKEMKAAQLLTAKLAKEIKSTDRPSKELTRNFEKAKRASAQLKDSHRRESEALHRLRSDLRGAGFDTLKLSRAEKTLGRSIDETRRKMERVTKAESRRAAASKRLSSLKGRAVGAVGLAYGASRIIGGEADVEKRFTRLGIQANISSEKVAELRQEILDVSREKEIKVDPTKILAAIEAIVEKTGNLKFAKENIRNIGLSISATGSSGEAIGELMAEFEKMPTLRGPEAVLKSLDTLNVQGKEGAFTLKNLAALGPRIITAYASAVKGGRNAATVLREMGAAIQVIRMGTGTSEQAATAFEAVLRTLQDSQKIKALSKIGIQVFDPNQPGEEILRPITDLMTEIVQATGGKKTIIGDIFDAEAIRSFNALIQNPAVMRKFIQIQGDGATTIRDSGRAAGEASQTIQRFEDSIVEIGNAIGGSLTPEFKAVFEPLTDMSDRLSDTIKQYPVIGKVIGGLTIGLVGLATGLGVVATAQWAWNTALVSNYFSLVRTVGGAVLAGATATATAVKIGAVTAAQWAWNVAMTANPIGLVIAGVATLAAGAFFVYKNWNTVTKWFGDALDGLADMFNYVGDVWNSIFGDKTQTVRQKLVPVKHAAQAKLAPAALAATLAVAAPAAAQTTPNITQDNRATYEVKVNVNGGDPAEVEQAVKRALDAHSRDQAARSRAALYDRESDL